ncbi:hypothetical protein [Actinomadura rugatobispora]|uniref:XRE family transcriptional regulator n=1 Tax=Actinomadura rugatobispora TaxID=1994 RepID=A0ABW1A714_9ACTN|nr:hypothetical protein GCM10010200_048070 [Actinomadura rugatobispora]
MPTDKKAIGLRLREVREATPYWSRGKLARLLRAAADPREREDLPHVQSLTDMIKQWESGKHLPAPRYRKLYARVLAEPEPTPAHLLPVMDLPTSSGHPADGAFVEALRRTNEDLVRLDGQWGGHDVLSLAVRVFRRAHHKIGTGAHEPAIERDLLAAAGETGEITAWLAYDADQQALSRQLIMEALMLSRQAGDLDMELFELSHLAMQSLHLNRPTEAMRITAAVLDEDLPPRVAALFELRRARVLAQSGDEHRAMAAIEKVRCVLSDSVSPRDPRWTWWLNETEVNRHKATAYTRLRQWERAVPLHEEVVVDDRAAHVYGNLDMTQLLEALVHVRDWRRAEDVITEIAVLGEAITRGRAASLLRGVLKQIRRAGNAPSTVTDTAETLERALA